MAAGAVREVGPHSLRRGGGSGGVPCRAQTPNGARALWVFLERRRTARLRTARGREPHTSRRRNDYVHGAPGPSVRPDPEPAAGEEKKDTSGVPPAHRTISESRGAGGSPLVSSLFFRAKPMRSERSHQEGGSGGVPSRAQFAGAQYVLAPSKPIRRARRPAFEHGREPHRSRPHDEANGASPHVKPPSTISTTSPVRSASPPPRPA